MNDKTMFSFLLGASLAVMTGCGPEATTTGSGSATSAKSSPPASSVTAKPSAAVSAAPSGSAAAAPAGKPLRTGKVTPLADLQKIVLPVPAPAPKTAAWKVAAPGAVSGDGYLLTNLIDKVGGKDEYWYVVTLRDCRDGKKTGDKDLCDDVPTEMFEGFPIKRDKQGGDPFFSLVVGNYIVVANVGASGAGKVKDADVEAFLKSLDLAAISKL